MGADLDLTQRTVVLQIAVMNTLVNGAFNRLVGIVVHVISLPYLRFVFSMPAFNAITQDKSSKKTHRQKPVCLIFYSEDEILSAVSFTTEIARTNCSDSI